MQSLLRLAPVVDSLQVDEPAVRLAHLGAGRYDIDDVLARLQPAPDAPASEPARFALYNLVLQGARIDFADATVGRTHAVRDLSLNLPFLSNLDADREVKVAPALAFTLNGSRFDTRAEATPFAQTRKTDATVRLAGLDLTPYLGYLPRGLPWRLQSAVVDADLQIAFEQSPQVAVRVRGTAGVRGVRVIDARSQDLLGLDSLRVRIADLQPLARRVTLDELALGRPRLWVSRDRAGQVNLLANAGTAAAAPRARPSSRPTASAAATPWQARLDRLVIEDGRVDWADAWPAGQGGAAARMAVEALGLQASAIRWPMTQALSLQGSFRLRSATSATPATGAASAPRTTARPVGQANPRSAATAAKTAQGAQSTKRPAGSRQTAAAAPAAAAASDAFDAEAARFEFAGTATDRSADITATVADLRLSSLAPYLQTALLPALDGRAEARVGVHWVAPSGTSEAGATDIRLERLRLDTLRLGEAAKPLATMKSLDVEGVELDLIRRAAVVAKVSAREPRLTVEREADGRWAAERWIRSPVSPAADAPARAGAPASARTQAASRPAAPRSAQAASAAGGPAVDRPWTLRLADLRVESGALGWRDALPAQPVALDLSSVALRLQDLSLGDSKKPASVQLAARVAAGKGEPGRVGLRGRFSVEPLSAQGNLDLVRLPLHALAPYAADVLAIELLRADAHFKGQFRVAQRSDGPQARVSGDASIEDLRALTRPAGAGVQSAEELLNWKTLNLRGLSVAVEPGQAPSVDLREASLSDFFARVIIHESGRINLQDIVRSPASGTTTVATVQGSAAGALPPGGGAAASAPRTASATTTAAPAAARIQVGPVSLVGGRVLFSDRFVRPNYTANLTELTGRLGAFSSVPAGATVQMADLELRGRAEGTASLEITGQLNPLAQPLALNIRGKVRDLELPPLSPYTIKYAGHGIERGKLSVDVAYVVRPDGQLTASNQIILNQLRFGDKVEGAPASLPVKLAVALLADRNGVIDINLPIAGSLNDPQFSLGPIFVKVIVNLIVKAVTAPFSLLASALGGGGEELSQVGFAPGSAALSAVAREGLDKVVRALQDRPALRLTVVGTAHPELERDGLRRERLQALVLAEKRRAAVLAGQPANAPVSVSEAEYPALLREVYRRADIPKPRTVIGLARELPVPEMQTLLLSHMAVTPEQVRELALQRAVAVKDYVASRQLPAERLFLGAPRLATDPAPAPPGASAASAWKPRAELNLTLQ